MSSWSVVGCEEDREGDDSWSARQNLSSSTSCPQNGIGNDSVQCSRTEHQRSDECSLTVSVVRSSSSCYFILAAVIMAAAGGNMVIIRRYVYRGEEGERIPDEATHITMSEDVTFVRARAFYQHQNIIEVICHTGVEKIEQMAFHNCPSLRRVVMPGVKIVVGWAFFNCEALEDVECGRLEIIREQAFGCCKSLRSINLPSSRIVGVGAFQNCEALFDATFGNTLERFEDRAFSYCPYLEQIAIPLKDGVISRDDIFFRCHTLMQVDLIEGVELQETIAALQLEEWRNDMNRVIDSINRILLTARNCYVYNYEEDGFGERDQAIRAWIRSVLRKIAHYQAEHRHALDEAAATLKCALPHDIVMKSVLSFLELQPYTFG